MPGTVSDVSATLVASTMRLRLLPPGLNTRSCSAWERRANSGRISASVVARPCPGSAEGMLAQRLCRLANFTLARKKDEHIARSASNGFIDRIQDGLFDIAFVLILILCAPLLRRAASSWLTALDEERKPAGGNAPPPDTCGRILRPPGHY